MEKITEERITKPLENFEEASVKSTFANRLITGASENVKRVDEFIYPLKLEVKKQYRRVSKYVMRRQRVRDFLLRSLDNFSEEHVTLVGLIENGDAHVNHKDYQKCKHNISVTLRATKRLGKLVNKPAKMIEFMNEMIEVKRRERRYQLAID